MLDAQARRHGDRLAISALHQGAKYTYSTLRERVRERASQLLNSGVRSGDRIILLAGNCVEYVDVFLAVAAVGAISVLIAPGLALSEVQNAVQSVGETFSFLLSFLLCEKKEGNLKSPSSSFEHPPPAATKKNTAEPAFVTLRIVTPPIAPFETFC